MKKRFTLLLLFVFTVFFITGCGNEKQIQNESQSHEDSVSKHVGTIEYHGITKEIEVVDYQINYVNLLDYFSDFDSTLLHNIESKGTFATIKSAENEYSAGNNSEKLSGNILYIYAGGKDAITQYEIENNFSVKITDFILVDSIDWDYYITFSDLADKSNILGVSLLTLNLEVNNVSDEDLTGKITNVFINDKPISSDFIFDSTYTVWKKKQGEVKYFASSPALKSAGEKNVTKIGLELELSNEEGNVVYKNTKWLKLN